MTMPNFILIGAQKSGTTAIAHYLAQHPQVFMSPIKEPGFFDFEGEPPGFKGPGDQELYSSIVTNLGGYSKLFEHASDEVAIGEATTWYLYSQKAPGRIKHYIPNVKLIAVLRNPIDRAYSAYMHAVRDNRESLDFIDALKIEEKRISDNWEYLWHYSKIGYYSEQLQRYFSEFDQEQLRFYLFEDLNENPESLLRSIFHFLDVDQEFMPAEFKHLNVSGKKRSRFIDRLLKDSSPVKQVMKPLMPTGLRRSLASKVRSLNLQKIECPPEARVHLRNVFKEDILRVQEMIGRDLSHWLKV